MSDHSALQRELKAVRMLANTVVVLAVAYAVLNLIALVAYVAARTVSP